MSIALHGNLRDFGIGEVFQLIGQQRKTGVLEVRRDAGEVALRFDAGGVVSAAPVSDHADGPLLDMVVRCGLVPGDRVAPLGEAGAPARALVDAGLLSAAALREVEDLLTRETIFELLRWEEGSFRFVAQPVPHDRSADSLLGAEQVLMDGLRMVDEWQAFRTALPDEQIVFRRRGSLEEYRHSPAGQEAPSRADAERVFLLIDGRSNVRRVADLSRLGSFLALRALAHLARSGWIEPLPRAREEAGRGTARPSALRRRLAVFAPLLALAAVAGVGWLRDAPRAADARLGASAFAEARARIETAQVRAAMLGYRLAEGHWPATLEALAAWSGERALTHPDRGYYLGRSAEGPLLLAPDPARGL